MSDQSLREALEDLLKQRAVKGKGTVPNSELRDLLAAHPVEPAPRVSDDLLAEAMDAYYREGLYGREANEESMRAALEAVLGSQPMPTREQIAEALAAAIAPDIRYVHQEATEATQNAIIDKRADKLADAMLALLKGGLS